MKDIERATMLLACYNESVDDCGLPLVNQYLEIGMKGQSEDERVCGFLIGGCISNLYTLEDLSISFSTTVIEALRPFCIDNPTIPRLIESARQSQNQLSVITIKRYCEVVYDHYLHNGHPVKAKKFARETLDLF